MLPVLLLLFAFPGDSTVIAPGSPSKTINFFIVSKRKRGAIDLASRFNVMRSKLKSAFRQKKFVSIVASDASQASAKIRFRLQKYDAHIGTLWFDSHGMYKKGYSLFFIGRDEYSEKTIRDSLHLAPLTQLAAFSDERTRIVIGSCYGGATYSRASIDYKDTTRMNGDSLMIALGQTFNRSLVFGCESWVMTKPGLFLKKAAVTGYPGRRLFLDSCYQPVWQRVGQWNVYDSQQRTFGSSNPIALDMYGNAIILSATSLEKKTRQKNIAKSLQKLKAGLYK
jgi:hypothetical protein